MAVILKTLVFIRGFKIMKKIFSKFPLKEPVVVSINIEKALKEKIDAIRNKLNVSYSDIMKLLFETCEFANIEKNFKVYELELLRVEVVKKLEMKRIEYETIKDSLKEIDLKLLKSGKKD